MKSDNLKNFEKLVSKEKSGWKERAEWRKENKDWLDFTFKISVKILREIRRQKPINGMTQKKLAEELGVKPQYVNRILKGKENLTLKTITSIGNVLGIKLLEIPVEQETQEVEYPPAKLSVCYKNAHTAGKQTTSVEQPATVAAEPEFDYIANA
jgi:transcriptional regulator with XRE-family HTH domain